MIGTIDRELTKTDRNGKAAGRISAIANWAADTDNGLTRPIMESVAGDRNAELPKFHGQTFEKQAKELLATVDTTAPAKPARRSLRDVFCELQQPGNRRRRARSTGTQWRGDGSRLSRVLRHAATGTGRPFGGRRERQDGLQRTRHVDR